MLGNVGEYRVAKIPGRGWFHGIGAGQGIATAHPLKVETRVQIP
jgi:hypothetical protein